MKSDKAAILHENQNALRILQHSMSFDFAQLTGLGGLGAKVHVRTQRRRTMAIHVTWNEVEIRVPRIVAKAKVVSFVKSNKDWIARRLETERQKRKRQLAFGDGSRFLYLGERRIVRVTAGGSSGCLLEGGEINIMLQNPGCERGQRVMDTLMLWFKDRARKHLVSRTQELAKMVGHNPIAVGIGRSKSAWGTCSKRGKITFSWRLMQAPGNVIDSVIIHELCHLIEHNHSKAFWANVRRHDPHHKSSDAWFKDNHDMLFGAGDGF